jgi:hypothetical protein
MGDQWADFLWRCLDHQSLGVVVLGISDADQDPEKLYLYSLLIQFAEEFDRRVPKEWRTLSLRPFREA